MNTEITNLPVYEKVSKILLAMKDKAVPGITTMDLNNIAERLIKLYDCRAYNIGYKPIWAPVPYPTATCISVNGVIAHGVPNDYKLQSGDLVSFDLGIVDKNGLCGDAALTIGIGELSNEKARLLRIAKKTLYYAISLLKPGVFTKDIAYDIEHFVLNHNCKINRRFAGHRIGTEMHMKPNIYNTTEPSHVYAHLRDGQVYCLEPMITNGKDDVGYVLKDGWQTVTRDGKCSAFFEHMVEITKDGCNILTNHITMDI